MEAPHTAVDFILKNARNYGKAKGHNRPIGFVLRGAHHAENIRMGGAKLDQAALGAAYASENWAEVDRLVSDDVVRRHTACGTASEVRAKIEEYRAIGLDEVVLGGMDTAETIAAALKAALDSFAKTFA